MKKLVLPIMFILLLLGGQEVNAMEDVPNVSAQSAIVYHADSGRVLWEKHGDSKMLIASTTKIMTALITIEACDLNESVKITDTMANVEGSSMYLKAGESYTVRELLYGLMLASGNDAATALAIHVAGDEASFAEMMNEKAQELGMVNSSFENPHGLDGERHYSTAADMARLAAYAMENDMFAEIVGTRNTTIKGLTYVNHNKLLWQCDGVIGLKTGYTKAAGRTLVTCCERQGQRLICVTLSAPDDWNDHKNLYDWAYRAYESQIIMKKDTEFLLPIMSGDGSYVTVEPLTDVTVFKKDTEEASYTVELPRFSFCPIYTGNRAGRIVVNINGVTASEVPLVYMEDYRMNTEPSFGLKQWFQKLMEICERR